MKKVHVTNRIGDGPIEQQFILEMTAIANALDDMFNGDSDKKNTGFVLLVFPYGNKEGRCNYISNGADRGDIVKLMEEQIKRFKDDQKTQRPG